MGDRKVKRVYIYKDGDEVGVVKKLAHEWYYFGKPWNHRVDGGPVVYAKQLKEQGYEYRVEHVGQ